MATGRADPDGNLLVVNDPFTGVAVEEGRLILTIPHGIGVTGYSCSSGIGGQRMILIKADARANINQYHQLVAKVPLAANRLAFIPMSTTT